MNISLIFFIVVFTSVIDIQLPNLSSLDLLISFVIYFISLLPQEFLPQFCWLVLFIRRVDAAKQRNINVKIEMILSKYKDLKEDAVRAFKSYIKHIAQMKDKKVFNVLSIDRDAYARWENGMFVLLSF